MKKIFFLNTCVAWGGGEKWTFETAKELDKRGYKVIVGSVEESELYKRAQKSGIEAKVVPIKGSASLLNPIKLFSFVNYLKRENIEVLFLNLSQDLKFGAIAGRLAGVEQIIYRRGSAIPIKDRFYTKFLLGGCVTHIIANSKATKETILRNTSQWLDENKIEIIYNGIKLEQINSVKLGTNIRKEFGIGEDEVLMANVGRLSRQKGHQYLVKAIDLLREKVDNFKVLLVGKGELEIKIKAQVRELGLEDYIIFTGFRTDVYSLMDQIDFLVHTALWEGFGFVIAEAMAVAKPVVSTDVSNIAEIMVDGQTGYLAEAKNSQDIADKILQMIRNDQKRQMGQKGREVVRDNFIFTDKVDQLERIYFKER
ncbi:glycosyltransferase family 4 protein [Halonatronum saccharophilum]|uniref:glycosyltransferase family 4 protein n=1 Tax=Halonatronum saccharophilum TaxID=150060 RepID=UPI0004847658|nr:glycosyltransferase family 4 protein [Halonatronum saccharophilum]